MQVKVIENNGKEFVTEADNVFLVTETEAGNIRCFYEYKKIDRFPVDAVYTLFRLTTQFVRSMAGPENGDRLMRQLLSIAQRAIRDENEQYAAEAYITGRSEGMPS